MSSVTLSEKLKNKLPNKKIFIVLIILLVSLTLSSVIALANENTVVVEAELLNVRYGPGLSHEVLTHAKEKDRLHVLGEENKWYKVRLENDEVGWVASWLVNNNNLIHTNQKFVRVNAKSVNIRQFADPESDILGVVHQDTELQVLYNDGSWQQVLYMGQVAWIHKDYTKKVTQSTNNPVQPDPNSIVQTENQKTNIRSMPSMNGDVIYLTDPGESFDYIETVSNWHHVQIDENRTGYIAASVSSVETKSIEKDKPKEIAAEQPAGKVSSLAEATIVVDAGHGGKDSGAISPDQTIYEKNIALNTALLLKKRLEDAGTNVILTRDQDIFVSLDDRLALSHQHQADAFISLHYDAVETANSMSGTTTYYQLDENLELARTINKYLTTNGPLPNNGVRLANYKVLRENKQPAVLLELGYMNHSTDTQIIDSPSYQSAIVEAIYQSLREYYSQ